MRTGSFSSAPDMATISRLHRKLFDKLDANHDGRVSAREMKESGVLRKVGVSHSDEEDRRVFETIDTDKDGALSAGESFGFFASLMSNSPEALIAITAMTAREPDRRPSAEALGAEADLDRRGAADPLDPDDPDRLRHEDRADRLSPAWNEALARDALRRAAERRDAGATVTVTV